LKSGNFSRTNRRVCDFFCVTSQKLIHILAQKNCPESMFNFGEKFSFSQEFRLGSIVRYNLNQELFLVLCETIKVIAEDN
jgi:hypothetical protein